MYSCHDKSGQRIFTGIDKNYVVCPYTDEDSRIEHMISHGIGNEYVDKKIGFSFLKIVGLLFLIKIFNIMSFRILFGIMMRFMIRGDFTTINLILIWASFFVNLIGIPVCFWLYVDGFVRGKPKEMSLSNTILVLISLSFCIANFII